VVSNSNISPNYFWDELTLNEANAIIDSIAEKDKAEWERTRWTAYIQAVTAGAQLKTPIDLIKFSWEENENILLPAKDNRTKEEIFNGLLEIKNSFL